jgi:tricorn protease-like protein
MSWTSSRWSTLFKIIITNKNLKTVGTLNLVDLAGSEIRKEVNFMQVYVRNKKS